MGIRIGDMLAAVYDWDDRTLHDFIFHLICQFYLPLQEDGPRRAADLRPAAGL